jgi:hypothetical protein
VELKKTTKTWIRIFGNPGFTGSGNLRNKIHNPFILTHSPQIQSSWILQHNTFVSQSRTIWFPPYIHAKIYIEITFNRLLCELYRNIRLRIHTVNIASKRKWMWWIKRTTALCILPSYKVVLQYEEEIYAFLWPQEDIRKSAGQPFYLRGDFFTQRTQRPSWSSDASFFIV